MSADNFVEISYFYSHPPSKLWEAWTNPLIVKLWFGSDPNGTVLDAMLDVQINGSFKVKFANVDGTTYTAQGIYKEVELNKKLVFTWGWEEQPHIHEWVQVRFELEKDGTLMQFEHHDIDKNSAHNYAEGWKSTFKKIERALSS